MMAEDHLHVEPANVEQRPWLKLYDVGVPACLDDVPKSPLATFEAALAANPWAIALYYFESPLTYHAVDVLARCLAERLSARGVGHGDRVAVLNQNSPATVVTVVAAWRLGAAVVPLNPMLTSHELEYYFVDSGAAATIVGADVMNALPECARNLPVFVTCACDFLCQPEMPSILAATVAEPQLEAGWERFPTDISSLAQVSPVAIPVGGEMAFLTYTSGTTGKPKGAVNSHANAAYSAEIYRRWLDLGPDDVMLAAAPFSHVTGLIAHIAAGFAAKMPIVLAYRFEPGTMLDLIERLGCTTTVAAITAYVSLMEHAAFSRERVARFSKLLSGGAPVAEATVERWERATGTYIHNAYGLTETTSPSHLVPMGARAPVDSQSGALSVGVPVPGTDCRVAEGEDGTGELLIRGPQVVAGYWHKPDETMASFAEGGWLRTGDVCRRDADGWFYIVDRAKDMIVASGFKIWPREVEDVLLAHPDVLEAAVIGVPDDYRGERPQAHVILREGRALQADTLVAFCRERLAAYKVPRDLRFVCVLPKTASGKTLRRLLQDPS